MAVSETSIGLLIIWLLIAALGAAAYLLPSIVAYRRGAPSLGTIVFINLFLGWTIVGWAVAAGLAFGIIRPRAV
jgi:nitric oxide reductase large subunit